MKAVAAGVKDGRAGSVVVELTCQSGGVSKRPKFGFNLPARIMRAVDLPDRVRRQGRIRTESVSPCDDQLCGAT
jgi:hypothetical protein